MRTMEMRKERWMDLYKDTTAMWPARLEHNVAERLNNKKKEEYPEGSRLVIWEYADTREEALRLADRLNKEYDKGRAPHMIPISHIK